MPRGYALSVNDRCSCLDIDRAVPREGHTLGAQEPPAGSMAGMAGSMAGMAASTGPTTTTTTTGADENREAIDDDALERRRRQLDALRALSRIEVDVDPERDADGTTSL